MMAISRIYCIEFSKNLSFAEGSASRVQSLVSPFRVQEFSSVRGAGRVGFPKNLATGSPSADASRSNFLYSLPLLTNAASKKASTENLDRKRRTAKPLVLRRHGGFLCQTEKPVLQARSTDTTFARFPAGILGKKTAILNTGLERIWAATNPELGLAI
jgi:hypothetical protein